MTVSFSRKPAAPAPAGTPTTTPATSTEAKTHEAETTKVETPAPAKVVLTQEQIDAARALFAEEAPKPEEKALTAPPVNSNQTALANPSGISADDVDGEVNMSDIKLPRINLVQKTGELSDSFPHGDFTFVRTVVLPQPLTFIPLHLRKQYQEKTDFDDPNSNPQVYNTFEEVRAAGGRLGWGMGEFTELAHIFVLIQKPENLDANEDAAPVLDLFMYEIDGKLWAPAIISAGRSAYTSLAKPLLTARQFQLKAGLWHGKYQMEAVKKTKGALSWYVPTPKFLGKLSPENAELANKVRKGE